MSGSQISDRIRASGLRPTTARTLILQELDRRQDHPTAEQLLEATRDDDRPLSTATLYQNLVRLTEAGLVRRFSGQGGVMRFEANLAPHHHLVCSRCGRVSDADLDDKQVRRLKPVELGTGAPITDWKLQTAQIELSGLCPTCQADEA